MRGLVSGKRKSRRESIYKMEEQSMRWKKDWKGVHVEVWGEIQVGKERVVW